MEKITAKQLICKLEELKSDDEFIKLQERTINTNLKIIGVRVPVLRKLAKEYFKTGKIIEFDNESDKYFEGVLLEGLLISLEKDKQNLKEKLDRFYYKMDNWAVVDMVCSSLNAFKKSLTNEDFKYFAGLLESRHAFTVRFGVVSLMKYFINEDYLDNVLTSLNNIKCSEYYVEMGIAWLISEVLIKNPQKAKENMQKILKNNHFNKFIMNKSIQKACESFRIDDKTKQILREMKIK